MLPAACCTLLSVARNSQENDIKLVIVGIDLPEDQKARVATFNAVNGIDIDVVDFTFPAEAPETAGRWHKSTLARLYLDKLMGEELERVLYLDADILAVGNVDPLFDVNLNGKAIGAVDDYRIAFPDKIGQLERELGLDPGAGYFNAGVFLMDCAEIRAGGFFETARSLLGSGRCFASNDQDILNIAFRGTWQRLDNRWNVQTGTMPYIRNPVLMHFTGRRKPWHFSVQAGQSAYAAIYSNMLSKTPWSEFVSRRSLSRKAADYLLSLGKRAGAMNRSQQLKAYFGSSEGVPMAERNPGPENSGNQFFHTQGVDAWRAFFNRFSHIVLVANSEALDPQSLRTEFPGDTLFVFFNKVYKVLDDSFPGHAILVARSGMMGANIVHRREVDEVLKFFTSNKFLGVLNIRTAPEERFSPVGAFNGATVLHSDLETLMSGHYPPDKIPTSGFALVAWMQELQLKPKIVLAGFSGKRSARWKVFDVHDWTFERIYFRLLAQKGIITSSEHTGPSRFDLLKRHFPDTKSEEIQAAINDALASRLDHALTLIDGLMSLTKWQRALDQAFRKARPKTRKQRALDRQKKQAS
jgi:lipopolysaccharide biosynthesis glycosyltransferase